MAVVLALALAFPFHQRWWLPPPRNDAMVLELGLQVLVLALALALALHLAMTFPSAAASVVTRARWTRPIRCEDLRQGCMSLECQPLRGNLHLRLRFRC